MPRLKFHRAAGGRRLEEVRELAAEQEVLAQLGLQRLPSADALGDWLRRQGKARGVRAVQRASKELIRPYLKSLGEELTIDPDATIIEAHKREAEWTYQKVKGYQPLLAYVNEVSGSGRQFDVSNKRRRRLFSFTVSRTTMFTSRKRKRCTWRLNAAAWKLSSFVTRARVTACASRNTDWIPSNARSTGLIFLR